MRKGAVPAELGQMPADMQLLLRENTAAETYRRELALSEAAARRVPGRTKLTLVLGVISTVVHPLIPFAVGAGGLTAKAKADQLTHGNGAEDAAAEWRATRATRLASQPGPQVR